MTVYAVAESVLGRFKHYLTAGKKYEVLCELNERFSMIDDDGDLMSSRWESSAYLGGGNWTRIEETDDQDAAEVLRDDAPELLEALSDLLAYLEDGLGDHDSEEGKKARALIAKHRGES